MARRNHKEHLKETKPKPKKEQKLETANDFADAANEHEEAAGKWRVGDPAKSMRFFNRAIETYDQGLKAFPQDLDLAYNKARIFLEVAQHPALLSQLHTTPLDWLQKGLQAHRYALKVDPNNADTLFNTSQVLTSIAEEIANDDDIPDKEGLKMLEEALELQGKCLTIQSLTYDESVAQQKLAAQQLQTQDTDTTMTTSAEASGEQEASGEEYQDATVIEPVTEETLIDTVLAQMTTLTTLCDILSASSETVDQTMLTWAEEKSQNLLLKLQDIPKNQAQKIPEIVLTRAKLGSALLETGYRSGNLEAAAYKNERDALFASPELGLENSHEALMSNAWSLMSFSSALAEIQFTDAQSLAPLRWNALTESIQSLKLAAEVQGIDNDDKSTSHRLRGDCSLQLHNLRYAPWSHQSAVSNAAQFLKHASVFYRNAKTLSSDTEQKNVAGLRQAVAEYISTLQEGQPPYNVGPIIKSSTGGPSWAMEQLGEMEAEWLLPPGFLE